MSVPTDDTQHDVFERAGSCTKLTSETLPRIGRTGTERLALVDFGGQEARVSLLDTDSAGGAVRGATGQRYPCARQLVDYIDQRLGTRELDFFAARFETNAYHASPL